MFGKKNEDENWNLEMKIYPKMEHKKAWNRIILVILGLVFLKKRKDRLKPTCLINYLNKYLYLNYDVIVLLRNFVKSS